MTEFVIGQKVELYEYTQAAIWCNKNNACIVERDDGYYIEEVQPHVPTKEEQIAQLKSELAEIDSKSARSMRAILAETATEEDRAFLANLEQQAEAKREELKQLGAIQ